MAAEWPTDTQVLVVDDDQLFRESVVTQFKRANVVCHSAATYGEAAKTMRERREIGVVLLDHPTIGARVDEVVQELRSQRPDVLIIGNSGADRRDEFATAGVTRYLDKPWRLEHLARLVRERINNCGECGLPLPLRRSREDEATSSWACAFCGSRYAAVLDEDAPPVVRPNVREI